MTPRERENYLYLADGNPAALTILWRIQTFKRSEEISHWLVKNQLNGKKLETFFKEHHKSSMLSLVKYVISKIDKERELVPLFKKDFK